MVGSECGLEPTTFPSRDKFIRSGGVLVPGIKRLVSST